MEQEDEYLIPLQDQRVFGAGIKRRRVAFVPASSGSTPPLASTSKNIGDHYLSIVFPSNGAALDKDGKEVLKTSEMESLNLAVGTVPQDQHENDTTCQICNLPIQGTESTGASFKSHQAMIAHQVCLPHSFPPSHLDRKRHGLKYLSSYGWDPDSRLGLGAAGEGIRAPIKVTIKNDTTGLGFKRLEESDLAKRIQTKVQKLDAKQVRHQELKARKRGEKLQEMIYRHDDVEKYLGSS